MRKGPGAAAGIPCSRKAGKGTPCLLLVSLYLTFSQVSGGQIRTERDTSSPVRPGWERWGHAKLQGNSTSSGTSLPTGHPPLPAEAHTCPRRAPSWVHTRRGHGLLCARVHSPPYTQGPERCFSSELAPAHAVPSTASLSPPGHACCLTPGEAGEHEDAQADRLCHREAG